MSVKPGLPDGNWTEEEILSLLEKSTDDASREAGYARRAGLEELGKRAIENEWRVADVLIAIAKKHGTSKPVSTMVTQTLSDLANSHEEVFQKLLDGLGEKRALQLHHCITKIIRNLNRDMKKRSVPMLIDALMSSDSSTYATEEMYETLVSMDDADISEEVVKLILSYLDSPYPYRVANATRIISRLADEEVTPELCKIIEKSFEDWYSSHNRNVQKEICRFFQRVKDVEGLPILLELIEKRPSDEGYTALASIVDEYPETVDKIMDEIARRSREGKSIFAMLYVLENLDKVRVNIDRLFELVPKECFRKATRNTLKNIVIKTGKIAKLRLLKMVTSSDEAEYGFALECLKEIGVSIDAVSACFEKSPILQVYNFFYEKNPLEKIWEEQKKLGDNIKRAQIKKFDHFIQNLFSAFNFVTLYVDPAGKEGVDIVAFAPSTPHLFMVGCTIGVIKDDLQKINVTFNEMKEKLRRLVERYIAIPLLFTAKKVTVYPTDSEFARQNGIVILTQKEIAELLEMLKTGRKSQDFIEYIESRLHQ